MRMRQLHRIERVVVLLVSVPSVQVFVLVCAGILPRKVGTIAVFLVLITAVISAAVRVWVILAYGPGVASPKSEDGRATKPTGIWVDDETPLQMGMEVLAYTQHKWWNALVVGFESRGRAMVHYVGWSHVWDETHDRKRLQFVVHPEDASDRRRKTIETRFQISDAIQDCDH
jgi:hypothetical protein